MNGIIFTFPTMPGYKKYRKRRIRRRPGRRRRLNAGIGRRKPLPGFTPYEAAAYGGAAGGYVADRLRKRYRGNSSSSNSSGARGGGEAHNDYKRYKVRFGKRLPTAVLNRRVLRDTVGRISFGLADYGPWNRGSGNIPLESVQTGTAGTRVIAPVHLWDISAVPNAYTATNIAYPYVCHRLTFTSETDGATCEWQHRTGATSWASTIGNKDPKAITVDKTTQLYEVFSTKQAFETGAPSIANANSAIGGKSYLQAANMRMCLYGPQQAPVKFLIQIVQLHEDVGVDKSDPMATAFWQAIAKPYGYSPLEIGNHALVKKKMKVLKSRVITLDAPESIEDHVQARMRQLNMQVNLNRKCNYNWGYYADKIHYDEADMPEEADFDAQKNASHVHPNARVYVMIRALTTFQGPSGTATTANSGSYDIRLYASHRKSA